ncbi:MAG: YeeE/YedE thiosulfate transporter family protein, partial [Thioalkalispiraceae bacterium]
MPNKTQATDLPVVSFSLVAILFLSLFLQHAFDLKQALLFLIGVGLGISLMHALFGFSGGWRVMIVKRRSQAVRAQILLFALSCLLFFPVLGQVFPDIQASGAFGPFSVSVLVGAFLFGMGMQLGGGCGSGTLYTVGWGQTDMLITLTFFIVG